MCCGWCLCAGDLERQYAARTLRLIVEEPAVSTAAWGDERGQMETGIRERKGVVQGDREKTFRSEAESPMSDALVLVAAVIYGCY